MVKKIKGTFLLTLFFLFPPIYGWGQNGGGWDEEDYIDVAFSIPEIALIDMEPSNVHVKLSLKEQVNPGEAVEIGDGEDNSIWINYTSTLSSYSLGRSINAQVTYGTVPPGISLYLSASEYKGNGKGSMGSPTGTISLSNSPQTIISNIGRCYTGNGKNKGHRLTYTIEVTDYSKLEYSEASDLQVTYTISDI